MEPNQFKNKFDEGHESFSPSHYVWESIDNTLSKKYKRKKIVLWFFCMATFVLGGGVFFYFSSNLISNISTTQPKIQKKIENELSPNKTNSYPKAKDYSLTNSQSLTNTPRVSQRKKTSSSQFNKIKKSNQKRNKIPQHSSLQKRYKNSRLAAVSSQLLFYPKDSLFLTVQLAKPLYINKQSKIQISNVSEKAITWSLKPSIGFNLLSFPKKENLLYASSPHLKSTVKTGYSYGLEIGAKVSKRLWVSTGFKKTTYNYELENINTTKNQTPNLISYISSHSNKPIRQNTINEFNNYHEKIDLRYSINFYEIPVTASYQILSSKLNMFINGGASFYYLHKTNSFLINSNNEKKDIGEFNIFSEKHYSFQLGIIGNYPLNRHLFIELEGLYNYHFNFQSTTATLNIHSIGINLGLKYQFDY